jgi:hypothetical protein
MADIFMYVVDRDVGFAPNPFHGYCTLATCKSVIRKSAEIGDWVVGMGGSRLGATGRCIFAMKVTSKVTFNEYWSNHEYRDKKPVRNGSLKAMIGDNIYHRDPDGTWHQADSHHSRSDGRPSDYNLGKDTKADSVLISRNFIYFGSSAPEIPPALLQRIGFKNGRSHRRFAEEEASELTQYLLDNYGDSMNLVLADPFDFAQSAKRYSGEQNKIV